MTPTALSEPQSKLTPAFDEVRPDLDERAGETADVDLLFTYVRQIGDGRLLTAAEEAALARRKDAGDEAAPRAPRSELSEKIGRAWLAVMREQARRLGV
jgi:hypothetical protein